MTPRTKRFLVLSTAFVTSLLVMEVVFRLYFPQRLLWETTGLWQPHDGLGRASRTDIDLVLDTGNGPARIIKNQHGHRVGPNLTGPADINILGIGDSFMEAVQVDYEETFCAQLEHQLSEKLQQSVRIANAALGGWNPNQYLIKARQELEDRTYDAVLVTVFLGNDRIDSVTEYFSPERHLLAPRLERPWLSNLRKWMHHHLHKRSHLYTYSYYWTIGRKIRAGTYQNHMMTPVMKTEADSPAWDITADRLAEIQTLPTAYGLPVLYVLIPPDYYFHDKKRNRMARGMGIERDNIDLEQPSRILLSKLGARGCRVIDTTPALGSAAKASPTPLYGKVDIHLAPEGHRVVNRVLAPALETLLHARTPASLGLYDFEQMRIPHGLTTSMTALPDDRILLGLRDGRLYVVPANAPVLPEHPLHTFSTFESIEGGVVGLAHDPGFLTNGWIYAFYTELDQEKNEFINVSRLRIPADTTGHKAAEPEVIFRIPDEHLSEIHYGGGMVFDDTGCLLIGTGDDTQPGNSQDPASLRGKVLRIHTDGTVPIDNPILPGMDKPTRVFAMGLRNPFRMVKDSETGRIYIHDSGASAYEEINLLSAGANYGWPLYEGPKPSRPNLEPPPQYHPPLWSIPHPQRSPGDRPSLAITGGLIAHGAPWNAYLTTPYLAGIWQRSQGVFHHVPLSGGGLLAQVAALPAQGAVVDMAQVGDRILYTTLNFNFEQPDASYSTLCTLHLLESPPPPPKLTHGPLEGAVPFTLELSSAQENTRWILNGSPLHTGSALQHKLALPGTYMLEARAPLNGGVYGVTTMTFRTYHALNEAILVNVSSLTEHIAIAATVNLYEGSHKTPLQTFSVAAGEQKTLDLRGKLFSSTIRLEATAPGHAPLVKHFRLPLPETISLVLGRQVLAANILDPSGDPLPYTAIQVQPEQGAPYSVRTDSAGWIWQAVENRAPLSLSVPAEHETLVPFEGYRVRPTTAHADATSTVVFALQQGATQCSDAAVLEETVPYEAVQAIFDRSCIGCHGAVNPSGNLPLTRELAYRMLYDQPVPSVPGRKRLDPTQPESSYLLEKLNCLYPSAGFFMPPSSRGLLPEPDRQVIYSWIMQGMPPPETP